MDILMRMDPSGSSIASPEIMEKLTNKKISASMITGLEGCHTRWLAQTFVVGEVLPHEPDNAASRGSMFHRVMERFFARPEGTRNVTAIKEDIALTLEEEDFAIFKDNADALEWLMGAINNYRELAKELGENVNEITIADVVTHGRYGEYTKKGLEVFVSGKVGESSREVLGFVDRVVQGENGVVVEDWKTGGKAKKWNPKTKSNDGLAEQRQQILYSMLLEQSGNKVEGARLIYPVAKDVVDVDLNDEEMKSRVIADVEKTDQALDKLIENNQFGYSPSFLCPWCPVAKICSKAKIARTEKSQGAYSSQPDALTLSKVIESTY